MYCLRQDRDFTRILGGQKWLVSMILAGQLTQELQLSSEIASNSCDNLIIEYKKNGNYDEM